MKLLSFLRWKYRQSTFEDICWWIGAFLIGIGVGADFDRRIMILGVLCWMGILVNFTIKHYKKEYEEFKQEQNQLFETIKNSDQK